MAAARDRPRPSCEADVAVDNWLDAQPAESIWTTSVKPFEIRTGMGLLPSSRRRRHLEDALERVINEDLHDRVLSFDPAAANAASALVAGGPIAAPGPQLERITRSPGPSAGIRNTVPSTLAVTLVGLPKRSHTGLANVWPCPALSVPW